MTMLTLFALKLAILRNRHPIHRLSHRRQIIHPRLLSNKTMPTIHKPPLLLLPHPHHLPDGPSRTPLRNLNIRNNLPMSTCERGVELHATESSMYRDYAFLLCPERHKYLHRYCDIHFTHTDVVEDDVTDTAEDHRLHCYGYRCFCLYCEYSEASLSCI